MNFLNITVERDKEDSSVVVVSINRPRKLNAISVATLTELRTLFGEVLLKDISTVRVVVVTGSGPKAFSAGLDLSDECVSAVFGPTSLQPGSRAAELKRLIDCMQLPILAIAEFPRPVIAAVNGLCIGLGVDLISACDIRVCSSSVQLAVREIKIGICADLGSLFFLPRICQSESWVREICYTGRIFGAAEALANGLVSSVAEDALTRGLEIAREIARGPPVAVEGIKVSLNQSARDRMRENFSAVSVWNSARLQETDTIQECVAAVMKSKL